MIEESQICHRIKKLRIDRKLTLKDLSQVTGFSSGYLSKMEKSRKSPPISTLITIAKGLGVNIDDIFAEDEKRTTFLLLRKDERQEMGRPPGSSYNYTYIPLAQKYPNRSMDPYILTIPIKPRGSDRFQHKGEEVLYILEGRARFAHGDTVVEMEEGDCIYFDASVPHRGTALDGKDVKAFMVIFSGDPATDAAPDSN
ncbi:MAG: XRE family transcriptional regulator [bacterium]